MKTLALAMPISLRPALLALALLAPALRAQEAPAAAEPPPEPSEIGRIVVESRPPQVPPPLVFTASVEEAVTAGSGEVRGEMRVRLHVVQGSPEVLTLGLSGEGDVTDATGEGLRDWAVRQAAGPGSGPRLLDLRLTAPSSGARDFDVVVHTLLRRPAVPGTVAVLLAEPAGAVGFSLALGISADPDVDLAVRESAGLSPVGAAAAGPGPYRFLATGEGRISVSLARRGGAPAEADLVGASLSGSLVAGGASADFHLVGQLRSARAGARLRLLSGQAALSGAATGDGWHVELVAEDAGRFAYDLVGDRAGVLPVQVSFAAAVREDSDWRSLDFMMPAGAVVPVELHGLGPRITFKADQPFVPVASKSGFEGFLPSSGAVRAAWRSAVEEGEGALAFTSTEETDVRVGPGLLRESARISLRVLQGKLGSLSCRLDGPGEILGVEGQNVVGWRVVPAGSARSLEVRFSRPIETLGTVTVRSQQELGGFPLAAEPLRVVPQGGVRHSGFLRVANSGSVRLGIEAAEGLMQLAPEQFPGEAPEAGAGQVFVYRFPAAGYRYRVTGSEIVPEVAVSEVATYLLSETDRVITASLELDVREAPLRDWSLLFPADYTVASVTGQGVSDYTSGSAAAGGYRPLRIQFDRAVEGRELIELRLERSEPAAAGQWRLEPLAFPGAKSVRGHVAAAASAGYRMAPASFAGLAEIPLSYFPAQAAGLQQAWRVRGADWSASVKVEALGQSVQADVFHLYTIKEGVLYGSVLLNYFVVGAPATEWRIAVPAAAGNIDVAGQGVQRDWRRDGQEVVVSLHQPVLGPSTVLVTFEEPMSAVGGTLEPGEVRPLGVQAERGYIEVASPLQVKFDVRRSEGGLLRLEPMELPAEFRLLSSSPALAVYQYSSRPFRLSAQVEWYRPADTVEQVVDYARLTSHVSRDGQVSTDAEYFVKTHGRKALRLTLPAGVKLWETRVDGEAAQAQVDGGEILVPLPSRANANDPVRVVLHLGQAAGGRGGRVALSAPRLRSSIVTAEWILRADPGRVLVPAGGNAGLVRPALREDGFEWISARAASASAAVLVLAALGALLARSVSLVAACLGLVLSAGAACGAAVLAVKAAVVHRPELRELTVSASMVSPGESVAVEVLNTGPWQALFVGWGVAALALGAALGAACSLRPLRGSPAARSLLPAAVVLAGAGLLAQRGGAVAFFAAVAAAVVASLFVPALIRVASVLRALFAEPRAPRGGAPVVPLLGLAIAALCVGTSRAGAGPELPVWAQEGSRPADSIVQRWEIRGGRLSAEADVTVHGKAGESFLLLRAPAVLSGYTGEGLHLGKVLRGSETDYFVALETEGTHSAHLRFEMAVDDRAGARTVAVPTGPAGVQRLSVELDQGGWEFASPMAVQVLPASGLGEGRSGATLVLSAHADPRIVLRPRRRDTAAEEVLFFAETENLFVPGPGVVDGRSKILVRPAQGRVAAIEVEVPAGLTVGDVHGPVGSWRFDPSAHRLRVALEPAQSEPFSLDVETQQGAGPLPFSASLEPLRVLGAQGQAGTIAIAFGPEAQPEEVTASGLSPVSPGDIDPALLAYPRAEQAPVQRAWRFGAERGSVAVRVAAVAPEVRVQAREVVTLDDERLVMAVDLNASITRAGVFKLSFQVPDGLEVEALSGPSLSQWAEADDGGHRVVTLNLKGRTLGDAAFAVTLAGPAPKVQASWLMPRLSVREASRETGEALLVPGRGLRLRVASREGVAQVDPPSVGGLQPGTLAFRLLERDWSVGVGVEALEPWVTVQSLEEVTVREGQTLTRIGLRYHVDNASLKLLRLRLPGIGDGGAVTVRATGAAVGDIGRVPGTPDLWEIRLQRAVAGDTDMQVEYQRPSASEEVAESVAPPVFPGARQVTQFVAVRAGGRIEVTAGNVPRGWVRGDWGAVPAYLQDRSDRTGPALCLRSAEPEGPLTVLLSRHLVADELKLRVTQGNYSTVFSESGSSLTLVDLRVQVVEKSTLRVRLPEGARLFNTLVNGEGVAVVRDGDGYLFHVSSNSDADRSAAVRLVYSAPGGPGAVRLTGPSLNIPLENVSWRVVVPPGRELRGHAGDLELREDRGAGFFGIRDYKVMVDARREADARKAVVMLEQANSFLQSGDQQRAGEMLSRASNAQLDQASNEDARVQLRNLRTEQTLLGLNTRRQRMYLDNRVAAARNDPLEQAASLNPLMRGSVNFDPQEADQLMQGNTVEETAALHGIASRIVDQQLAGDPPPGAVDITLPDGGRVATFTRSLQVEGGRPLSLSLEVGPSTPAGRPLGLLLLLGAAAVSVIALRRSPRPPSNP